MQYDGDYIAMSKQHKKDWDEVEKEVVADWIKMLRKGAATNPLFKVCLEFVEASAVISVLDGRHRQATEL